MSGGVHVDRQKPLEVAIGAVYAPSDVKVALVLCALVACGGGHPIAGDGGADDAGAGSDASTGCPSGQVDNGITCVPIDPADPAQRSMAEVCARWAADHVLTDPHPFTAGAGGDCDSGTLSASGKADTLKRLDGFRWLAGLGPTSESATLDATDQKCANLESWWDFSSGNSPHSPPATAKCYTAAGAQGAGMSNIAWGNGPADSIDQFMEDNGNASTMGHRRWLVNPPLGPIGIGYWEGGGMYGSAECLAVFGASGTGPKPPWVAVPNPGFVPMPIPTWTWTFHSALGGAATATITVVRASDNANLPVTRATLDAGYGQDAVSWKPMGWTPAANETYKVTIAGLAGGDVRYAVKPVVCN
jgi:hypothetical protein